jgi:hypothetical protein
MSFIQSNGKYPASPAKGRIAVVTTLEEGKYRIRYFSSSGW